MGKAVKQIFFQETTNNASAIFTAEARDLNNSQSNRVGIYVYGTLDTATITLQAKPLVTNEESSPSFTNINAADGTPRTFAANSLSILELISGVEYRLSISGAGSTNISAQVIYD
jgi:hypothetical protein